MYTFPHYAAPGADQVRELVRRNPFASVVSTDDQGIPIASHLPVVLPDPQALRVGGMLWGHMARVNAQWRTFRSEQPILVIFSAAHAYVSAALYRQVPAVPTWNYSAVHVTAVPQVLERGEPTMQVLTRTVTAIEELRPQPWDMTTSLDRFAQIAGGVVAFALRITSIQSTFKLSQDKPDELWHRVHDGLAAHRGSAPVARDMAAVRCPVPAADAASGGTGPDQAG